MRITILTHGTRGDLWPMVALGAALRERGHDVTVAMSGDFRTFVEAAGLRFVALPMSMTEFIATPGGQRTLNAGGTTLLRRMARWYSDAGDTLDVACVEASRGAEALICNHLTHDRAYSLAEHLRVPVVEVSPFPQHPSAEFTSWIFGDRTFPTSLARRASHEVLNQMWARGNAKQSAGFRAKLGLSPLSGLPYNALVASGALILNPVSPHVFARPTDWPDNVLVSGFWELPDQVRSSLGEGLPPELETWARRGEAPVFLGFGSMPVLDRDAMLQTIIAATRATGVRAVLNSPWAVEVDLPDHLRSVGAVNHDRLLPLCAAAVHHGGIGTLAASLRAGLATTVCSFGFDQPWWGGQVRRLGVGSHLRFRNLDAASLQHHLEALLAPGVRRRAAELSERIRAEGQSTTRAAQLLDDWLVAAEPPMARGRRASARQLAS